MTPTGAWSGRGTASELAPSFLGWGWSTSPWQISFFRGDLDRYAIRASRLLTVIACHRPPRGKLSHRHSGGAPADADRAEPELIIRPSFLRRANVSRNSGPWQHEDYDVFDGEREVGRIYICRGMSFDTRLFGDFPAEGMCNWGEGWPVPLLYNDPEHWRERAMEARAVAEKMTDVLGKNAMMEIAEKYERLAARAFERLALRPESK
jgi:hypothetical protein